MTPIAIPEPSGALTITDWQPLTLESNSVWGFCEFFGTGEMPACRKAIAWWEVRRSGSGASDMTRRTPVACQYPRRICCGESSPVASRSRLTTDPLSASWRRPGSLSWVIPSPADADQSTAGPIRAVREVLSVVCGVCGRRFCHSPILAHGLRWPEQRARLSPNSPPVRMLGLSRYGLLADGKQTVNGRG
jgi:hypothetical protein